MNKFSRYYFDAIWIQVVILLTGLFSCIIYVIGAYIEIFQASSSFALSDLELVFSSVFLIDYIMCIVAVQNKLLYLLSYTGILDLLSVLPLIPAILSISSIVNGFTITWLGFISFVRLLKVLQLFRIRSTRKVVYNPLYPVNKISDVSYRIWSLIINMTIFLFLSAGVIYLISSYDTSSFTESLSWFDSLYFVIVSVTTVGYGDITAVTEFSRLIVIVIICIGFIIIPVQVTALAQAILFRPQFQGKLHLSKFTPHICICGIVDYDLLRRFINELFHPSQSDYTINNSIVLVILSPTMPSPQVLSLLLTAKFTKRVQFFIGNPKSFYDLNRIKAHEASAIYIISDVVTTSLRYEEDSIFLSALSVSRYIEYTVINRQLKAENIKHISASNIKSVKPRILVKLTSSGRSKTVLKTIGIDVCLSVQEMKYSLLAFGVVFPGFLALFLNLNRRPYVDYSNIRNGTWTSNSSPDDDSFIAGSEYSIFEIDPSNHDFSQRLKSMSFKNAILYLYMLTNGTIVLLAGIINSCVIINPVGDECSLLCYESLFLIAKSYEFATEFTSKWHDDDDISDIHEYQRESPYVDVSRPYVGSQGSLHNSQLFSKPNVRRQALQHQSLANPSQFDLTIDEAKYSDTSDSIDTNKTRQKNSDSVSTTGTTTIKKLNPYVNSVIKEIFLKRTITEPSIKISKSQEFNIETSTDSVEKSEYKNMVDHIVLILSSDNKETTAQALMLTIFYFVKVIRDFTSDYICVLSDRAEELIELLDEIEYAYPNLLRNIDFYSGYGRNVDHLHMCSVLKAKCVVILRPPVPSESSQESQSIDVSRLAIVNDDKNTIITSMNLHMLIDKGLRDTKANPFLVCEMVHESNVSFLRQGYFDQSSSRDYSTMQHIISTQDIPMDIFDWPLLTTGNCQTTT